MHDFSKATRSSEVVWTAASRKLLEDGTVVAATDVMTTNLVVRPFHARSLQLHSVVKSHTQAAASASHGYLVVGRERTCTRTAQEVSSSSYTRFQRGYLHSVHDSASSRVNAAEVEHGCFHIWDQPTAIRTLGWTVSTFASIAPGLMYVAFVFR